MTKKIPPPLPSGNLEKRNNGVQINDSKITYWFIPPEIGALQISLLQKNILGVVATFTRNGGECWATDVQFGEAFQWSRQKINAAINGMVAAGWLRKDVTRLSNGTTPRRLWLASPPIPLSPTVTSSTPNATDLVTHGDYPCHLGGLPLSPTVTTLVTHGDTNSNIIKKEKVIKNTVADAPTTPTPEALPVNSLHTTCELTSHVPVNSLHTIRTILDQDKNKLLEVVADAPTTPTLAESATPFPSSKPKPKTKAKKKPFPDEAYWSDAFPGILEWMKSKGFNGSDTAAKTWFDQCVERMRDACEANPSKYRYDNWAAAFRNWNRDRLFKESSSDAWIVAVFQYFWNETRTPVEKPQVTDTQRAAVNHALKKLGDSWRGGLSEATERDRPFRLKEFRDQLQETK